MTMLMNNEVRCWGFPTSEVASLARHTTTWEVHYEIFGRLHSGPQATTDSRPPYHLFSAIYEPLPKPDEGERCRTNFTSYCVANCYAIGSREGFPRTWLRSWLKKEPYMLLPKEKNGPAETGLLNKHSLSTLVRTAVETYIVRSGSIASDTAPSMRSTKAEGQY